MTEIDIKNAVADITSTPDLLERALKLAGLITTLFQRHGFPLVVVGDPDFSWNEAERLAALPSFGVLEELRRLRTEVCNG